MPLTLAQKFINLGMAAPLAVEYASQINTGVYNWKRLMWLGMVPQLAKYLTESFAAGTFDPRVAMEKTMSGAIAELTSDNVPSLSQASNRTLIVNEQSAIHVKQHSWNHLIIYPDTDYLEFWFPNWLCSSGGAVAGGRVDINAGSSMSATGQLTYYDRVTGSPVTVPLLDKTSRTSALFAADGANLKTYATGLNMAPGSGVLVELLADRAAGMIYAQKRADIDNGDGLRYSTTDAGALGDPVSNTNAAGRFWYGPCLVLGKSTGMGSLAIVGDSNGAGLEDVPNDGYGATSPVGRAVKTFIPTINVAMNGETAADFAVPSQSAKRRELIAYATRVAVELGTNDIVFQGRSAVQCLADLQTVVASLGKPEIVLTVPPATATDLSTPINAGRETQRALLNTSIRANFSRVYDIDGALSTAPNSGVWGNTAWVATDAGTNYRVHMTAAGNEQCVPQFNPAWIGSPSAVSLINWSPINLGSPKVTQYLPNGAYSAGIWTAAIGPNATTISGSTAPVSSRGGCNLDPTHLLESTTPSNVRDEVWVVDATLTTLPASGAQALIGTDTNGNRILRILNISGDPQLQKSGVGARGAPTGLPVTAATDFVLAYRDRTVVDALNQILFWRNGLVGNGGANNDPYTATAGKTLYGVSHASSSPMTGNMRRVAALKSSLVSDTEVQKVIATFVWERDGSGTALDASNPFKLRRPTL